MRIKTISIGLSAALMAAILAGPASAQDKPVYGVLLKTLSNPFWGAMEQGIQDGTKEAGVEYFLQAVESDQAAEPQLNTCNTMLQRKPAVMITAAINSTILLPCLKQANEMGIPVVDLDANLDHEIAEKAGVKIAFTIGSDNAAAGGQGADFMAEKLKGKKGSILVIEGLAGNITGQKRAKGFADQLAKIAPDLKVVASLPGDWDRQKAANITNDTMTANPDLVGIFCANDTMALGRGRVRLCRGQGQRDRRDRRRRQFRRREVDQGRPPQRLRRAASRTWSASRRWRRPRKCSPASRWTSSPTSDPGPDQGTDGRRHRPGPAYVK